MVVIGPVGCLQKPEKRLRLSATAHPLAGFKTRLEVFGYETVVI